MIALGFTRCVSYVLLGESGVSYRAAGWWVTGLTEGNTDGWKSHPRSTSKSHDQPGQKVVWEFGASARPHDVDVILLVTTVVLFGLAFLLLYAINHDRPY